MANYIQNSFQSEHFFKPKKNGLLKIQVIPPPHTHIAALFRALFQEQYWIISRLFYSKTTELIYASHRPQ